MASTAILNVKILTDASQAATGMNDASTKVGRLQGALSKMVAPAAIAVGAIGLLGKAAVNSASRTEQAMGAVESVFGRSAGKVKAWAAGAGDAVGLAKSEYGELASVLGAQLKNMGLPMDKVTGKTRDLIKLGADMSATYGGTTAEAVQALSSALRGETDPIERYGVSVKAADVAARQAADGTAKLEGEAGKAAKTNATLALITEQSADAHGAFAREADTAAGAQQRSAAAMENARSALGEALLPAMSLFAGVLTKVAALISAHPHLFLAIIAVVGTLAVTVIVLNSALIIYEAVTTAAGIASAVAWLAALGPILLVVAAVALVIGAVVLLWNKSETFKTVVTAVWDAIKKAIGFVIDGVSDLIGWIKKIKVPDLIKNAFEAIKDAVSTAIDWVAKLISKIAAIAVPDFIKVAFGIIKDAVKAAWDKVGDLIQKIKDITVPEFIKNAFEKIKDAVKDAWDKVGDLIAKIKDISVPESIKNAFNNVKDAVGDAWDKVGDLIARIGNISIPGAIVSAINGVKGAIDAVTGAVSNLIGKIAGIHFPSPPKWFSKVMPGGNMAAPTMGPSLRGARFGGPTATATTAPAVNITVVGAIDPEATARQIRRILQGHDRRVGLVS